MDQALAIRGRHGLHHNGTSEENVRRFLVHDYVRTLQWAN
jgi:hypothetical protein